MQILPLKFIHDDDKKEVGVDLFNLAKLRHLGLPVVESVVVVPPVELIKRLLEKYSRHNPDLKDNLGNLKKEVFRLKTPETLAEIYTIFYKQGKGRFNLNIDKLWRNLLEKWSYELTSKIERGEKDLSFTPQQVVFSANFQASGTACFDEEREHVVIKIDTGEADFKKSEEIENLVFEGNKKLFLPQVFHWVIEEGEVKIIKLLPYTESPKPQKDIAAATVPRLSGQKHLPKTATKILLDYSGQVLSSLTSDAVLLRLKDADTEKLAGHIDKILQFRDSTIIFYPNFLISLEQNLEYAKSFLFFKNKKHLDCQIVLPQTFSVDEFLSLKRQFASLGVYSKGSLKVWKQFSTVSDFINVQDYIDAGFDGAIIDLDKIIKLITGVEADLFVREPHIDWVSSSQKFFKDSGLNKVIKNNKQVLIFGTCCRNEELLNYFIKSGVWGIALPENLIEPLREHVAYLEKNILKTKLIN